ncbi:PREDICTED: uteroglobin isoform X2 [Chinchilla lanigera]|uniref:uteroglobin isoform X2 n=1 Tax=Chinchilla lanigera TaxID=34839 RepID=UPI00038EB97B|nr:PREDICTED: uteroglobin isoform X2 [Chinchilla lanigera]
MKLSTAVALLMLACSCPSGSAKTCPSFHSVLQNFLMGTLSGYESTVEPFQPDQEMKEAGARMKMLVDSLPKGIREAVLKLSEKIVKTSECA